MTSHASFSRRDGYGILQQENQELRIQLKSAQDYIKIIERKLDELNKNSNGQRTSTNDQDVQQMQNQLQQLQLVGNDVQILQREKQHMVSELKANKKQLHICQQTIERLQAENYAFKLENDTYREDFRRERGDREKTQSKLIEMEKELEASRTLVSQYSEQLMGQAAARRQAAVQKTREDYYRAHPYSPSARQHRRNSYVGRGQSLGRVVCDAETTQQQTGEDIIDSLVEPHTSRSSSVSSSGSDLQCPKCNQVYRIDDHSTFLEHIDACHNYSVMD